jgi:ABC-type multidrug transport system fused ATPase/permease subunit
MAFLKKDVFRNKMLTKSYLLLSSRDRRRILYLLPLNIILGLLDLLGVMFVGVIGALTISGVTGSLPGDRVLSLTQFLNLDDNSYQIQVTYLAIAATFFFVAKTYLSIYLLRRSLMFLSLRAAALAGNLTDKLFATGLKLISSKNSNEIVYFLSGGINSIILGILGTFILMLSDIVLLLILGLGLFVVDPTISISTFIVFSFVAWILYKSMQHKAQNYGSKLAEYSVLTNQMSYEVIDFYRELYSSQRLSQFTQMLNKARVELATASANSGLLPSISKYLMEITSILGFLIVAGIQFATSSASEAVAILAVFLAASSRVMPAVLRVQQAAVVMKSNGAASEKALRFIAEINFSAPELPKEQQHIVGDFIPKVEFENVSFRYPDAKDFAILNATFEIEQGEHVVFVGPSGGGKSTIVDLLLGILEPTSGKITVSGVLPRVAVESESGAISYVPQSFHTLDGTLLENITMRQDEHEVQSQVIESVLAKSGLSDWIATLPNGLRTRAGENGHALSGGQRQRLSFARALYTQPKLLILDEATSSLDSETEAIINETLLSMKGDITLVTIAHRLSTARLASKVVYIAGGVISSIGSFDEVRENEPNFDHQAGLQGL